MKYTRVQRGKFTDVELLSDRIFVEIEIFVRILLIGRLIGENEEKIKYIRLCVYYCWTEIEIFMNIILEFEIYNI